ncbi:bifunctional nitrate reductase/sulfite reductase flavoprotein subunit alpha [Nocardia brevicatena]|uniref:bifunctional nitrate reductase/sulfite reductase flavoprotein subunit alpha n=1 Tax=Nocardia brevicatena TaxID=37327 RepID=UPI0002E54A63|nr:bifunctional nitrate reductase/sulfite reductase flavoprotein subunit alpha [Nocardia brevicatena]
MSDAVTNRQPGTTRTACSYCGVGCGITVTTRSDDSGNPVIAKVAGDKLHPANTGRLCTKGATHPELVRAPGRMTTAYRRPERGAQPRPVAVDDAVREAAARLRAIADEHGPDAVALYVSGQMSLEAQYLATKLAKGYLRTVHIEANSRLCMASASTGYKQSLGADGPPGSYDDIDHADLFFVIGANMADCHPILYLRMADRLKSGARLIVVDPRRTETATRADLFLQIAPGTDLALLNGLLHLLVAAGDIDERFIAEHTEGWERMPAFLADYPPERVAEITGLAVDDIRTAARWIGAAGEWMSLWTMGLNQSTHGTWNTNAVCNLHLATGAICRPGSGPFSLTGQPNAMGGREMGYMGPGLPGQRSLLSADDRRFVETEWGLAPGTLREQGAAGTVDMFRAMAEGTIKAVWVICTNPVATVANRKTVIAGLEAAELVITQDTYTDTATNAYADILLPAAAWSEMDAVVVNSERTVTLQQRITDPAGDACPDWQLIARIATALGFDGFDHSSSAEVFTEITRFANPATGYDLRGMSYELLREGPMQWPCTDPSRRRNPIRYRNDGTVRPLFVDKSGRRPRLAFPTPSGRAVFWPRPHMAPDEPLDDDFPFLLNTGRLPHQWHSMTKTGRIAKLEKLNGQPFVEIHPDDARRLGLGPDDQVEIASRRGRAVLPVRISDRVRPGDCFAPFHWNDEQGEYLTINAVTNDAVDPESRQPEFKACAVALRRVATVARPDGGVAPGSPASRSGTRPDRPSAGGDGTGVPVHPTATMLGLDTTATPTLTEHERVYLSGYLAALNSIPVTGVPVLPDSAPLTPTSRLWVDGLLAGMYSRGLGPTAEPAEARAENEPGEVSDRERRGVTVLWASQTGSAEEFAATTAARLTEAGFRPRLVEMDSIDPAGLGGDVLVVSSTFGDGGPPDNGAGFWERLSGGDTRLAGVRYAVFALGDSSYDDFCGHGRKLDETFAARGATRLLARVDSDTGSDEPGERWLDDVLGTLAGTDPSAGVTPRTGRTATGAPGPDTDRTGTPGDPGRDTARPNTAVGTALLTRAPRSAGAVPFTRDSPMTAPLIRNEMLSAPGSSKEVRRFAFDLRGLDARYEVGDVLGIRPANAPRSVAAWLDATGLAGSRGVEVDGREISLSEALRTHYDITKVNPELLEFIADRNPHDRLTKLLRRDNRTELESYLWGRQAVDVLRDFPVRADLVEWLALLKRLQPRRYSISSSPLVGPDEVELTVGVVRYGDPDSTGRGGVCSTFLADRAKETGAPIFLQRAPHFKPPADPTTPMIMVGPGTGIAPFRGFLQERRALGATGRNWLFFGDQHAAYNFYYRTELEDMFRTGFLTRLDLAFSRDQRERIYVQHRMIEHGAELWSWLRDGAYFYVCGDAARMARDVDDTLLEIARVHGNMDDDDARAFRKQLIAEKRYIRDVY